MAPSRFRLLHRRLGYQRLKYSNTVHHILVETSADFVDSTDDQLESWFAYNASELRSITSAEVASVALWLPVIGLPANDNSGSSHLYNGRRNIV